VASDAPRFIVRPAAEADIEEAALWYELRSLGLGADFLRRARIRRLPYVAYFVSTDAGIRIVACMHAKRDPRIWQRRVDR
jgi:plasmid stabilization system protein ParE